METPRLRQARQDRGGATLHSQPQGRADAKSSGLAPGMDPWSWQYMEANMEPRRLTWGGIKPFMLKSPSQFAFIGPHEVTSAEFAKDLEEVRLVGGVNSTQRTADQTAAAIFWTVSATSVYNAVARHGRQGEGQRPDRQCPPASLARHGGVGRREWRHGIGSPRQTSCARLRRSAIRTSWATQRSCKRRTGPRFS